VFANSDDDEIVWGISSLSLSDRALFSPRSEDFVVLSPRSVVSSYATDIQAFIEDDLISNPPIFSQPLLHISIRHHEGTGGRRAAMRNNNLPGVV